MIIQELIDMCGDGTGQVTLVINRKPTGNGIRLTRWSGPIGYILCVNRDGNTVARFDAGAILRWVDRQKKKGLL